MKVELVVCGAYMENCYIVGNEIEVIIIDPGDNADRISSLIGNRKVNYILNTHGHIDHIGAVTPLRKKYGCPFGIHIKEKLLLSDPMRNLSGFTGHSIIVDDADIYFNDNDEINFLDDKIHVLHTPGHTEGGVCFVFKNCVFSGDTLFNMSIGRTDFPGGSYEMIIKSIKEKIMKLDDGFTVYPGHMDETTIGFERKNNPFLR